MPTYNRAHMLERTLSGIFDQTADPREWHLTVVDNASTDDTQALLRKFASKHANFDFSVNERNLGLFGNLNRCMDFARSEKYMIVHSDDTVEPTLIQAVLEFLSRHAEVTMCFGNCKAYIEETGELLPHWYRSKSIGDVERVLGSRDLLSALLSSASNFIFPPTVVYSQSLFTPDLRYSDEFHYAADIDLWLRAAVRSPVVGFISEPLVTCQIHAERLSAKHATAMRMEYLKIMRRHITSTYGRFDLHYVNRGHVALIRLRLILIEIAIRLNLIPSFKVRRQIASVLDAFNQSGGRNA